MDRFDYAITIIEIMGRYIDSSAKHIRTDLLVSEAKGLLMKIEEMEETMPRPEAARVITTKKSLNSALDVIERRITKNKNNVTEIGSSIRKLETRIRAIKRDLYKEE